MNKQACTGCWNVIEGRWKAIGLTILLGVGLHFLFDLWPSIITEFFAPVNESIWEHGKLVFWPLLLIFGLLYGGKNRARWLSAVVLSTAAVLAAGWLWHVALGGEALVVDLVIYAAGIVAAFCMAERLPIPDQYASFAVGAVILLGTLFFSFTLNPPHGTLFNDPALTDAWVRLTC